MPPNCTAFVCGQQIGVVWPPEHGRAHVRGALPAAPQRWKKFRARCVRLPLAHLNLAAYHSAMLSKCDETCLLTCRLRVHGAPFQHLHHGGASGSVWPNPFPLALPSSSGYAYLGKSIIWACHVQNACGTSPHLWREHLAYGLLVILARSRGK